jgi:hypothetical protein
MLELGEESESLDTLNKFKVQLRQSKKIYQEQQIINKDELRDIVSLDDHTDWI